MPGAHPAGGFRVGESHWGVKLDGIIWSNLRDGNCSDVFCGILWLMYYGRRHILARGESIQEVVVDYIDVVWVHTLTHAARKACGSKRQFHTGVELYHWTRNTSHALHVCSGSLPHSWDKGAFEYERFDMPICMTCLPISSYLLILAVQSYILKA